MQHFTLPTIVYKGSNFSISLPNLLLSSYSYCPSQKVSICISLLISNTQHLFICLLAIFTCLLVYFLWRNVYSIPSLTVSQLRLPKQNRLHSLNHRNLWKFSYNAGAWKFDIKVPSWSIRFSSWLIGSLHTGVCLLTTYQMHI